MALTFYLGNSTTTLGSGAAFNRFLEPNTGTAGSISVTLHHSGPLQQDGFAFTRDNALSSVDWVDQSIIVKLNVTTSANIDCRLSAARVNSAGVVQTQGGQSGYISFNTTGVKTFTIGSNGGWGTPSDTDRLMIRYDFFYPSGSKGGRTITFDTNTANSSVETPFVLDVFTPPSVTTNAASGVGLYGATLNGNLSALGDATTVDRFFEWREVGAGIWNTTTKNAQGSTGTFSQTISNLDHSTNYEFRAVAEYVDGTTQRVEGATLTFTTDTFTAPSVTTSAASGIGQTGATLNGNLTALGDATTVDRFFEWKEVGGPTWNTTTKNAQTVTGAFNQGISGLSSNTDYEFRAVVEYEDGGTQTLYGSTLTFKTDTVQYTLSVDKVGNGSVELGGTPITLPYQQNIDEGNYSLEALPDQYNEFVKWTVDGVDDFTNPLSLNLDANKTIVAYFEGQNAYIVEKYVTDTWTDIATLPLETTTYKDSSVFTIGTGYDYRLLKIENGASVTPPTLYGELELTDTPASIRLNWGEG